NRKPLPRGATVMERVGTHFSNPAHADRVVFTSFLGVAMRRITFLCLIPALLPAAEPVPVHKANYELAQHWTSNKVGKLVFDTSVTPHWIPAVRFWYPHKTSHGRRFYLVDPAKKSKAPIFDNAKMAAMLTEITRIPYDSQHLPIRTIKFVKN